MFFSFLNTLFFLNSILKAGGAFLYIDPSYPAERIDSILEDAQPRHIYTFGCNAESLAKYGQNMAQFEDLGSVFLSSVPDPDVKEPDAKLPRFRFQSRFRHFAVFFAGI